MSIKVLIVDDQQDNLDLLSEALEDGGFEVLIADNGPQAIQKAISEIPDVIVLDIQMPGMDGYEVCRILKDNETTQAIPLIFLTALYSSEQNIVKGLELGAYDYVTKPFREAELIARIRVMAKIKKTEEVVREESHTDPLTGLYNRRFLEKRFTEELSRAQRKKLKLGCLMFDIDHFKSINDMYGHDFGDLVLQQIAKVIQHSLRAYDTVARYGGEEFVIILPATDIHDAVLVAEKIRTVVEQATFEKEDRSSKVTISVGAYSASETELDQTAEHFIRKADEALYKAKGTGRNKVVPYNELYPSAE